MYYISDLRSRENISTRRSRIPSMKANISSAKDMNGMNIKPTTPTVSPIISSSSNENSSSILDDPIPSSLPEVPQEFRNQKSGDLIDLYTAVSNHPTVSAQPEMVNTNRQPKVISYMEVLQAFEKLQIK